MSVILDQAGASILDQAGVFLLDQAGGGNVNVSGATAQATVAAPAGAVSVSVAGMVSPVIVAAPAGTIIGSAIVIGSVATVLVSAPIGTVSGLGPVVLVSSSVACSLQAHSAVTAQATMGFMAGQPVQAGMTILASDPWISMYPG